MASFDDDVVEPKPDVVSAYPHLVMPFALFQVVGWVLSLSQTLGWVGPVAYTIMDSCFPIDIAFCQLMFWGTLHHGPLDDTRLSLICRVAFCVEAAILVSNCAVVYRPAEAADAKASAQVTTMFGHQFDGLPRNFIGYIEGVWWFIVFVPFSAWIGTTTLMVGRRRLVTRTGLASLAEFSTRFTARYVPVFCVQSALSVWAVANTLLAETLDEEVLVSKRNYAIRAVSLVVSQCVGNKAVLFDASGTTIAQFRAGKAPRAVKLGVCLLFVYWVTVAFDFILVYSTSRSDDGILAVHSAIELLGLENYPMMGVWLCAAYQFGMKLGHLVDVEKTEERLRNAEGGAHAFGPTSKVCPAEPELESA